MLGLYSVDDYCAGLMFFEDLPHYRPSAQLTHSLLTTRPGGETPGKHNVMAPGVRCLSMCFLFFLTSGLHSIFYVVYELWIDFWDMFLAFYLKFPFRSSHSNNHLINHGLSHLPITGP